MTPPDAPGAGSITAQASLPSDRPRAGGRALRTHPEVAAAVLILAVAIGSLLVIVGHLRTIQLDPGCITTLAASKRAGPCFSDGGHAALLRLVDGEIALLRTALLLLPFVVGALLGATVVARSLETGRFAADWATPPARMARLARRSWRRVVLAAVGLGVCGWLAAEVQWQTTPWLPRGAGQLGTYAAYGPLLPARGLLVVAVAVLTGTMLGRSLVAGVAAVSIGAVLVLGGSEAVRRAWIDAYPAVISTGVPLPGETLARTGTRWRSVNDTLLTDDEVRRISPVSGRGPRYEAWRAATFTEVPVVVPVTALPDLERTELLLTLGAAAAVAGAAGVAVTLRRPRSQLEGPPG